MHYAQDLKNQVNKVLHIFYTPVIHVSVMFLFMELRANVFNLPSNISDMCLFMELTAQKMNFKTIR